jgi:nucleoside-diphosphate-sugar epimerase
MQAVVTGASGFVGSHLVAALVAEGWGVRRLARPGAPPLPAAVAALATGADLTTFTAELTDPRALAACGALDGADVVFHVAGVTRRRTAAEFRAGNVAPTRALLDACAAARHPPGRLVLVSSQAAAGPAASRERPRTDDDPPAPVGAYGASKREAEEVVAGHPAALPWAIVRPCAVYGPRDPDFALVMRHAARGVAVYPHTRDAWLSLVHVGDLARALVRAGTAPGALGRALFVAGDEAVAWPEVYAAFARAAGTRLRVAWDAPGWLMRLAGTAGDAWTRATGHHTLVSREKVALGAPRYWLCSAAGARSALGWEARVGLEEGARELWRAVNAAR